MLSSPFFKLSSCCCLNCEFIIFTSAANSISKEYFITSWKTNLFSFFRAWSTCLLKDFKRYSLMLSVSPSRFFRSRNAKKSLANNLWPGPYFWWTGYPSWKVCLHNFGKWIQRHRHLLFWTMPIAPHRFYVKKLRLFALLLLWVLWMFLLDSRL